MTTGHHRGTPRRRPELTPVTLVARLRAVRKALALLHSIAKREPVFAEYGGHLLLAFCQIASTSRSTSIRRLGLDAGRERAAHWKAQWTHTRRHLTCDNVLQHVIASYAARRMGVWAEEIRADLRAALAAYPVRSLLLYDPSIEDPPDNVPDESRWSLWYYALTSAWFCECHDVPLGIRFVDVMQQLSRLPRYPPPGSPDYYDSIYAVTHLVYTLNGYGRSRLPQGLLSAETDFLTLAMRWALEQQEADTIGEIVDSLLALGVDEHDALIVAGRRFLLDTQRDDGGWGDEDDYGSFHTVWTAIDGLRDYNWRASKAPKATVRVVLNDALRLRAARSGHGS